MNTRSFLLTLAATSALTVSLGAQTAQHNQATLRHHRSLRQYQPVAATQAEQQAQQAAPAKKAATSYNNGDLFPPSANPGECWSRVLVTPKFETVTERVLLKPESYELVEVPAVLETVEERVMVKPASERVEIIPATYKEVEERVMIAPAYTRQIPIPAVYDTLSEKVLVKPERSYWTKGTGPLQRIDGATGEIMCYVTDPAVYETRTRKVLKTAATVREETVPAVYNTVTKTVVDQPEQVKKIPVAAEYKTVKIQKVKTAATTQKRVTAAEYGDVSHQVSKGENRMEWRRVLCETNVTPELIAEVQTKLKAGNFNPGEINGTFNQQTQKALAAFQASKGMPQAGLSYETLEALGIRYEG